MNSINSVFRHMQLIFDQEELCGHHRGILGRPRQIPRFPMATLKILTMCHSKKVRPGGHPVRVGSNTCSPCWSRV